MVWNLVYPFDPILSAMVLGDVFVVMATAIITGGILMIFLADSVAAPLQKIECMRFLGLFIFFILSIMLVNDGSRLAGPFF